MTPGLLQRMAVPLHHLIGQLHFDNTNFLRGQSKVCWPDSRSTRKAEPSSEAKAGDSDAVSTVVSRAKLAYSRVEADVSPVTTVTCRSVHFLLCCPIFRPWYLCHVGELVQTAMVQLRLRQWMLLDILSHQRHFMLAIADEQYSQSSEAAKKIVGLLWDAEMNDACTGASSSEPYWPPPQGLFVDGMGLASIMSHYRLQFAWRLGQHIKAYYNKLNAVNTFWLELVQLQRNFVKDALIHVRCSAASAEHVVEECSEIRLNQLCSGAGAPEPRIPDIENLLSMLDRTTGSSSGGGDVPSQAVVRILRDGD